MKLSKKIIGCASLLSASLLMPVFIASCSSSNGNNEVNKAYEWLKKVTREHPNRVATIEKKEKEASEWIKDELKKMGYKQMDTTMPNSNQTSPSIIKKDVTSSLCLERPECVLPTNEESASKIQISQTKTAFYNAPVVDNNFDGQNYDLKFDGFFETKYFWKNNDQRYDSQNVILNILSENNNAKDVFLVSHYDTANSKNDGTNDNSSGLAMNLAIAEYYSNINNLNKLNVNIHILFASAEEEGVIGTNVFVDRFIKTNQLIKDNTLWMINLDSVAGGDILYVHSPDTNNAQQEWNTSSLIRDQINKISNNKLEIHPQIDPEGFKKGETGDWSDHAPFYKNGIKVAYIESTNFYIKGKDGFDGYSQTINPWYWKKADGKAVVLEGKREKIDGQNVVLYIPEDYDNLVNDSSFTSWGKLWHMDCDVISKYNQNFPGRLQEQMNIVFDVLIKYIEQSK